MEEHPILSIAEIKRVPLPVVYGLCDSNNGFVVYVGKTCNPRKRFESYQNPKSCHNKNLSDWLIQVGTNLRVKVLEINPEDINASERLWINELKSSIFNLAHGGEQAWRAHKSKPWAAGKGIKCPSDLALLHLRNRKSSEDFTSIRNIRCALTLKQRCLFEVQICIDLFHLYQERMSHWLGQTQDRLIDALETPENRLVSG